MFDRHKRVRLDVALVGFDLRHQVVVAVCQQGKRRVRVTLDSIEFPELTPVEQPWLKAWQRFSRQGTTDPLLSWRRFQVDPPCRSR